jgi:hypothetical protein
MITASSHWRDRCCESVAFALPRSWQTRRCAPSTARKPDVSASLKTAFHCANGFRQTRGWPLRQSPALEIGEHDLTRMSFARYWKARYRCCKSASRRGRLGVASAAVAAVLASEGVVVASSLNPINHFCHPWLRRRGQYRLINWKTPLGFSSRGALSPENSFAYSAASFSFFSGRTFRRTEAGFAANHLSSPENGSLPKRFFLAGTSCATIFSRPGSVNSFAPFL